MSLPTDFIYFLRLLCTLIVYVLHVCVCVRVCVCECVLRKIIIFVGIDLTPQPIGN